MIKNLHNGLARIDNSNEKEYKKTTIMSLFLLESRTCFRRCFVFLTKQVHHRSAGVARRGWVTLGSRRDYSAARRHLSARLRRMSVGCVLRLY